MKTPKQEPITITRITTSGAKRSTIYPANSNAVIKNSMHGKVVWSGGTKRGSFKK